MIDWVRDWFRKGIIRGTGTEIPDNKSLYDLIRLDMLDHATYGLSALQTLLDNLADKDSAPVTKPYPYNANGVSVAATTTDWEFGSWTEIVPANTITEVFWLLGYVTNGSALSIDHVIDIGVGAAASEATKYAAKGNSSIRPTVYVNVLPVKVAANTRVAARAASEGTSADSFEVSIMYATGL